MTSPSQHADSYRTRWMSQGRLDIPGAEILNPTAQIIQDHLAEGWLLQESTATEIIFSRNSDGRKWTRHYDKKTCLFVSQEFSKIEEVAIKNISPQPKDWPPVHFGD